MARVKGEEGISLLGSDGGKPSDYTPDILETFENRHQENDFYDTYLKEGVHDAG